MRTITIALASVLIIIFGMASDFKIRTIGEKILDSIVLINRSSGVIIHADNKSSLVLTAYHTIEKKLERFECNGECKYPINVSIIHQYFIEDKLVSIRQNFPVLNIEIDPFNDLALLEVEASSKLNYSKLAEKTVRVGDEIFLGSNPQMTIRSLKKGIIGSLNRSVNESRSIEISGGIIFGSSGGGVFNTDGELVGIIRAVKMLKSNYCYDLWGDDDEYIGKECVTIPITFIGYAVDQGIVKRFILNSIYGFKFGYLSE